MIASDIESPADRAGRSSESSPDHDNALSIRSLSRHYGGIRAVDGIDLDVPRGEFLTLLGPSGSGKTTLLMMIAGFVRPTAGSITLAGRSIANLVPERRNFGMVFQGYALFPHMSVAENVGFPLRVRRMGRAAAEPLITSALELVQLGHLRTRLPRELSGGQQQRVALARALVFSPEILLLDEPLGALDRKLRKDVQIELKELHRRLGTTFIYVTHDQEEALSMADRVAIFRGGRIVQVGGPKELYEAPRTRFVADFLGESNFLRGAIVESSGDLVVYRVGAVSLRHQGRGSPGQDVVMALRPEKIRVHPKPPAQDGNRGDNTLECVVEAFTYLGSTVSYILRSPQIGRIQAIEPAWRVTETPEIGAAVVASWSASSSVEVVDD